MIVYHGSIKKFDHFKKEALVQNLPDHIDTIGIWLTADIDSARPFAIGTETIIEKSKTEFWDDGEPKVVQMEKPVQGFIYRVYMDEQNLKKYANYELFMIDRDKYCDYLATKKKNPTWKDQAILLNKEEANAAFRQNLQKQGYEGFLIHNTSMYENVTNLYCIFSEDSIFIADVIHVDE
ncbi:hypothetical protein [Neobacillus cucumis]|uniref:hypothetical protein n=1 Tax=Neobacillus cucumis TaxID=1740721 RepID=UPI001962307B|nr:hypothetical protein [Neobacillus cucumis]